MDLGKIIELRKILHRPQLMAEELNKSMELTVVYKRPFSAKNQSLDKTSLCLKSIRLWPFNAKWNLIRYFNKIFMKFSTSKVISVRYGGQAKLVESIHFFTSNTLKVRADAVKEILLNKVKSFD